MIKTLKLYMQIMMHKLSMTANLKLGVPKTNIMELNEKAEESDILLAVKDWVVRSTKNGVSDIYLSLLVMVLLAQTEMICIYFLMMDHIVIKVTAILEINSLKNSL